MKNLGRLSIALCVLVFGVQAHAEPTLSGEKLAQAVFLSMALDTAPDKSRLGVRSIAQQYPTNQELSDVIAELLLQSERLATNKAWVDTIAWYAAALRDAHNPRYTDILQQARQRFSSAKILKTIDVAIANTALDAGLTVAGGKQVKQYVVGEVDIVKKRAELQQVLLAHKKSDRKGFNSIQPSSSFDQVLESVGVPDDITMMTLPVARWGRATMLVAHYAGAGLFVMRFDRAVNPQWVIVESVDEPFPVKATYTGNQFGLAQTVASLRGMSFFQYIKLNHRAIRKDASLVAILGERLVALPYPVDRYEESGMEISMKFVAQSKDPGTTELMQRIAATTGKKVPRMAQNYLKKRSQGAAIADSPDEETEEPNEDESADSDDPAP